MKSMKRLILKILHGLNVNICRDYMLKILNNNNINLILDVGANSGQYASYIFDLGYRGRIISFEPLSCAYEALLKNSRSKPKWLVGEQCALGEINGEIKINVSKNSYSSSFLQTLKKLEDAYPESAYIRSEKVKICKFDSIAHKYLHKNDKTLLKIDVQGYEDRVLKGATKTLPLISGIQLECSLVHLYEGEVLFEKMLQKVTNYGFELYDIVPGIRDKSGRLLQVDCIFFRIAE